ncbi:MAG: hypothetical protein ACREPE_03845, partial [Lysobacter sp.]
MSKVASRRARWCALLALSTLAVAGSAFAAEVGPAELMGGVLKQDYSPALRNFVALTMLSFLPVMLVGMTSFTRIVIVLSLTRNALGLHTIPPNQVIVGLAMFLSFFVMSPTFGDINRD